MKYVKKTTVWKPLLLYYVTYYRTVKSKTIKPDASFSYVSREQTFSSQSR